MNEKQTENNFTIDDVFNQWLGHILKNGFDRFKGNKRAEQIEILAETLQAYNIDYDDAKRLKNKVIQALLSEDGYKKRNKHKDGNWLSNTLRDFDTIMAEFYVPSIERSTKVQTVGFEPDPRIVQWAQSKFGKKVSQKALQDCHEFGNVLYMMFVNDFHNRKTGGRL